MLSISVGDINHFEFRNFFYIFRIFLKIMNK